MQIYIVLQDGNYSIHPEHIQSLKKKTFKWDKGKYVLYFQESVLGKFINIEANMFFGQTDK